MDPSLIVFGIRMIVRLTREGSAAFNQYERDKPVLFPEALEADFRQIDFVRDAFFPDHVDLLSGDGPLAKYWRDLAPAPEVPNATEALYLAAVQLKAEAAARQSKLLPQRGLEVGGALMIQQWADGKGPVGPIGRVVLAMADLALEFVGANPAVLGLGANTEKLIGALAANLAEIIPDNGDALGPQNQFAERLVGIFLRAGLTTLNENSALVVSEGHLHQFIQAMLPPIIAALPDELAAQSRWRDAADALLGPAASAALDVLANNPQAYLGNAFDVGTAVGALTQALLHQASHVGLKGLCSEAGFLALYKAALGVAADRPALFLGSASTTGQQMASDLFAKIAGALQAAPSPFNADVGADLAAAALEALQEHGVPPLDGNSPWGEMVASLVTQVSTGLQAASSQSSGVALDSLLSRRQIREFAGIFLSQAARTPGLIGTDRPELQAIVQGVVQAMVQDKHRLLTPQDWLRIATVAAEEAAANPQRLFGAESEPLGTALINDLLAVATAEFNAGGRTVAGVLFGATLCEAIITALRSASGKAQAARSRQSALKALAAQLSEVIRQHPGHYGNREWLAIYRVLTRRLLQGSPLEIITAQHMDQILAEGSSA